MPARVLPRPVFFCNNWGAMFVEHVEGVEHIQTVIQDPQHIQRLQHKRHAATGEVCRTEHVDGRHRLLPRKRILGVDRTFLAPARLLLRERVQALSLQKEKHVRAPAGTDAQNDGFILNEWVRRRNRNSTPNLWKPASNALFFPATLHVSGVFLP
jgi:hypothetical protein